VAVVKGHVKNIVDDVLRTGTVKGILQLLEVWKTIVVEHEDFAIQPTAFKTHAIYRADKVGKLVGPVIAVARDQQQ
jgi:hypothetical protein